MNHLKLAGWVARTRPLTEPLSPRGPQPVLTMLENRYGALNGSGEPFEKYPSCSTAGAGAGFVEESEDCSKLFIIKLLEDTGPAVPAGPAGWQTRQKYQWVRSHVDTAEESAEMAGESHQADGESFD